MNANFSKMKNQPQQQIYVQSGVVDNVNNSNSNNVNKIISNILGSENINNNNSKPNTVMVREETVTNTINSNKIINNKHNQ